MTLFFTLASLLVFGFFSKGAVESYTSEKISLKSYQQSYAVKQKAYDTRERLKFLENKPKAQNPSTPQIGPKRESDSKPSSKKSRETCRGYPIKRAINLYSLLKKTSENQLLEELFLKLFKDLYHQESFYTENLGKELLEAIRRVATVNSNIDPKKKMIQEPEDLAALTLHDPLLQEKLYKVLKGSEIPGKKGGYPSLCDFLICHKRSKTMINLYLAREELLSSLFDADTAEYILAHKEEWKKNYSGREVAHGDEVLTKIINYYGKSSYKYKSLIIFRIRSE